jgi:hypothetical protein
MPCAVVRPFQGRFKSIIMIGARRCGLSLGIFCGPFGLDSKAFFTG